MTVLSLRRQTGERDDANPHSDAEIVIHQPEKPDAARHGKRDDSRIMNVAGMLLKFMYSSTK